MGVGVDKCRGYSDGVKGDPRDPSPTWLRKYREDDEEEAVTKIEITSWKALCTGFSHSLVLYQKSHSFAALTRSISDTSQLV